MRDVAWVMLAALVITSGAGAADTLEQDVAGNAVVVTYLETDERHTEIHDENTDLVYHQEDLTNGATVNGEGASVTLTQYSRDFAYHSGAQSVENNEDGARVSIVGSLAGMTTDQQATLSTNEVHYFFAPGDSGDAQHGTLVYSGNTYGNGVQVYRYVGVGGGEGQIQSPTLNPDPTVGLIQFVTTSALTYGGVGAGPIAVGDQLAVGQDTYLLDWNGVNAYASYFLARCAGTECDYEGNGVAVCLVGLRPPFFLDCL